MAEIRQLEQRLDSFDESERRETLGRLLELRGVPPASSGNVNMHFHSFYSYNAQGWSPTRIVWEASQGGLEAAGMCDFDVLDGLEEFLGAGLRAARRCAVHLETRAFVEELRDVDINSPGEHGVAYVMGAGFRAAPSANDATARELQGFRDKARERNLALVARIAGAVPGIGLDYERDVLPLTPAGVATERHIVKAFVDRSLALHGRKASGFFATLVGRDEAGTRPLMADRAALEEAIRSRLVKRGGLAYARPDETSFPPLPLFFGWVSRCGALPMAAWLDGTSDGESDADRFLDIMAASGACALNVIPERNWNITDPAERERKTGKLREIVGAAGRRHLPVNIGTEMNRGGLPFVDDLDGPVLREHREVFLTGAKILVGHTVLFRYGLLPYGSEQARSELGAEQESRNRFYASVGSLPPLTESSARRLEDAGAGRSLDLIRDSVRAGRWLV